MKHTPQEPVLFVPDKRLEIDKFFKYGRIPVEVGLRKACLLGCWQSSKTIAYMV